MSRLSAANLLRRLCGHRFPRSGRKIMDAVLRQLPPRVSCELFPGIQLDLNLNDLTQRSTYWQGERFEEPTPAILADFGAGATTFFDIGSNYGFFSYWMLHRLPTIEVYSFEPNPVTFELVSRARTTNALHRLHPQNLGLSDRAGVLELHPGTDDSGHSTFTSHPGLDAPPVANVTVAAFDEWTMTEGIPNPRPGDWVAKIDVEGFELKVLEGMRRSLEQKVFSLLAVEINEFTLGLAGTTPDQVRALLKDAGYISLESIDAGKRWNLSRTANAFYVPRMR